jgi:hypothetical protein
MLSSSSEYLQALREDNFLRFLEWPQFIAKRYKSDQESIDADTCVNLLLFEWLNNGFCELDAKQMAILYAVAYLPESPIQSVLSCGLTSLFIANYHCMVYQNNNLQKHYINEKLSTKDDTSLEEILTFMKQQNHYMADCDIDALVQSEENKFEQWVVALENEQVTRVAAQIRSITQFRYLIDVYILCLESSEINNDQLKESRVSLLRSLNDFMNEQTKLTPPVIDKIREYGRKLWNMKPAPFEEFYLDNLYSLSFTEHVWKQVTVYGGMLFSFITPPVTPALTDESNQAPRNW